MVVFLIVAGFFALLAGAATWAVVRLQRIELVESKQELERYKLEAGEKIVGAEERAAEATQKANEARERAVTAEAGQERDARLRLPRHPSTTNLPSG